MPLDLVLLHNAKFQVQVQVNQLRTAVSHRFLHQAILNHLNSAAIILHNNMVAAMGLRRATSDQVLVTICRTVLRRLGISVLEASLSRKVQTCIRRRRCQ